MITEYYFEDFIGVFHTNFDTLPMIEYFEKMRVANRVFKRKSIQTGSRPNEKVDSSLMTGPDDGLTISKSMGMKFLIEYNNITAQCLSSYCEEYEQAGGFRLQQTYLNIQKTLPKQGYHLWHCEHNNSGAERRVLATMLYLNDVEDGGETEFLYQSKRYKPTKGTMLIWPAGFTHTHRGNPPLTKEKYIATSWLELS